MLLSELRPRRVGRAEALQPCPPGPAVAADAISRDSSAVSSALSLRQAELLTGIDLFARLARVALARLAAWAEAGPVAPGGVICRVGEPADGLYVIAKGSFGVYLAGQAEIGEV